MTKTKTRNKMQRDLNKAKSRKKVWDLFKWGHKGLSSLSKNHSLNCGCLMCQYKTYHRRYERKQERLNARKELNLIK